MRALLALVLLASPATAAPAGLYPPGFTIFCERAPAECEPVEPAVISFAEWMPALGRVNRQVNAAITYRNDPNWIDEGDPAELYERIGRGDVPPGDEWTIAPAFGDCDDYVITKRQRLIEAGIPRGAMRAAYVLPYKGEPHLVLVVSTARGEMVLDNRMDEVVDLSRMMVSRLSIQSKADPRIWEQRW